MDSEITQSDLSNRLMRPDTPNLEQRAEMAIRGLTAMTDPDYGHLPYFRANFSWDPPVLWHSIYDYGDASGRWLDALTLARQMTGSDYYHHVDEAIISSIASWLQRYGLLCYPDAPWLKNVLINNEPYRPGEIVFHANSHTLQGLVSRYVAKHDDHVKQLTDRMINNILDAVVKKDDYCYIPASRYVPGEGWEDQTEPPPTGWPLPQMLAGARYVRWLVRYFEETDHEEARILAEKLVNWVLNCWDKWFGEDGSYRGNTISGLHVATGFIRFGQLMNRPDLVERSKKIFDFLVSQGSSYGFFPEFISSFVGEGGEPCVISDMIDMAINLAKAGWKQYWNNAERYTRNHLFESQLLDIEPIKRMTWPDKRPAPSNLEEGYTDDNVLERVLGGHFAGWSAPNDFFGPASVHAMFTMQGCCNGHGTRALYMAWQHVVTKTEEGTFVNLLFSRDTHWVEVNSYLPYEGKLELRVHDAPILHVRMPDWVTRSRVIVDVNDQNVRYDWKDAYLRITNLRPHDIVLVRFPVRSKIEIEEIKGSYYVVEWKGDTVISVSPLGTLFPLYQRDDFKVNITPKRTGITYHVPHTESSW